MALPRQGPLLDLALEVRYRIYGFLFFSPQPILASQGLNRQALTPSQQWWAQWCWAFVQGRALLADPAHLQAGRR